MKILIPIALLALGAASCRTNTSYNSHGAMLSVDDDTLVKVPVSDRDAIMKERTESDEMRDRVAVAERDVTTATTKIEVAEKEVDIANAELKAADKRCEVAHEANQDSRDAAIKDSEANRQAVSAHRRWADAQVAYQEHRKSEAESKLALEKMRLQLADTKVELAKAKAVNALKRNDIPEYDIAAFDANVADKKMRVAMAEVDVDAWKSKLKLCRDGLEEQAKAVPSSYRNNWRTLNDLDGK